MLLTLSLIGVLAGGGSCEALRSLTLPNVTIAAAERVASGPFVSPDARGRGGAGGPVLPAHCRVAAVLTPSADSHIEIEVWLPTDGWNGKFQAVGNGGWAGTISFAAMAAALREGYATASTDTGHKDARAQFAVGHPEKVIDFAYRSMHETVVAAKAMVAAFYGQAPRLSYYNGCSTGGRQGLMEAQRYPDDFDAIVAGAPVHNMIHLNESQVALQAEMLKDPARIVPPGKVALFANAVIAACDAKDGVRDGIVSDPDRCTFDPATLQCKGADAPNCLTAPQVESAKRAYASVTTKAGELVYPGRAPGFETGWRIPTVGAPVNPLFGDMPHFIGNDGAEVDPLTFDLDSELARAMKKAGFIEATDPNLAKFKARGGKLILYHGWADPGPAPANTIRYYSEVTKALGGGKADDWMRLFLLPGVGHCGGGPGPDQADFVAAIERWREGNVAPDRIIASHVSGNRVDMTRPLCPYPQVAQYKAAGSPNDAGNFVCKVP